MREPQVVGSAVVAMLSLRTTGTPASGPGSAPRRRRRSPTADACATASASVYKRIFNADLSHAPTATARSSAPRAATSGSRSPRATASPSSAADSAPAPDSGGSAADVLTAPPDPRASTTSERERNHPALAARTTRSAERAESAGRHRGATAPRTHRFPPPLRRRYVDGRQHIHVREDRVELGHQA